MRLPQGVYVILAVPIRAHYMAVTDDLERDATAQLESAAGLVAAVISPNAVYQQTDEFIAEATGPGTRMMSPPIRRPAPIANLDEENLRAMSGVLGAMAAGNERLQARVATSLRWYSQAQADRNRTDAFVKFWVALEALAFGGNGNSRPLVDLLATHYEHDAAWVRATFAIDPFSQLRNAIVHDGRRPMLHGNVLTFVDAVYVDALHARLGLPNLRRAELALPEGTPFNLRRWQHSGGVATAFIPNPSAMGESDE